MSLSEEQSLTRRAITIGDVDQFANEIDHMSRCIKENREPHTPGQEGLQDIRLIKTIYESIQSGRRIDVKPIAGIDVFRGSEPTY